MGKFRPFPTSFFPTHSSLLPWYTSLTSDGRTNLVRDGLFESVLPLFRSLQDIFPVYRQVKTYQEK